MSEAEIKADKPSTPDGQAYHTEIAPGSLAPHCLLVGSPERAEMVATKLFTDAELVGSHRGLKSFTGRYQGMRVSVVTTGMGGPSAGIVLPDALRSGARAFVHVGSCGGLKPYMRPGDAIIATGAVRLDGASENWAPMEYPAVPDWRVVQALHFAARMEPHTAVHSGIGITSSCFYEGQAREDYLGYLPERLLKRHEELVHRGAASYSMEEAAIFVWCSTHGGIPCGSINAVFANRLTNEFKACGEEEAAKIALGALRQLAYAGIP
jgi:uridine phosphorylase